MSTHPSMSSLNGYKEPFGRPMIIQGNYWAATREDKRTSTIKKCLVSRIKQDSRFRSSLPIKQNLAKSSKFMPWVGPFTIVEKLSDRIYKISKSIGGKSSQIVHYNRLKPVLSKKCVIRRGSLSVYSRSAHELKRSDMKDDDQGFTGSTDDPQEREVLLDGRRRSI